MTVVKTEEAWLQERCPIPRSVRCTDVLAPTILKASKGKQVSSGFINCTMMSEKIFSS